MLWIWCWHFRTFLCIPWPAHIYITCDQSIFCQTWMSWLKHLSEQMSVKKRACVDITAEIFCWILIRVRHWNNSYDIVLDKKKRNKSETRWEIAYRSSDPRTFYITCFWIGVILLYIYRWKSYFRVLKCGAFRTKYLYSKHTFI